jgi:hypothetical protein
MKTIEYFKLEVTQLGMPLYNKQTIEINSNGEIQQILFPMVYLGQARIYNYTIDESDIKEFLSTIDISSWQVNKKRNSLNTTWTCFVKYSDGSTISDNGCRTSDMIQGFQDFDSKLLEMVPFIEIPWLFTK